MSQKQEQSSSTSDVMEITWNQYHAMVQKLGAYLLRSCPSGPIYLIGPPRGGRLITTLLEYESDRFKSFCGRGVVSLDKQSNDNLVVVDDVLETGATRKKFCGEGILPFVVLIDKSAISGCKMSDFAVLMLYKKQWVQFPYENPEDPREVKSKEEMGYGQG